MINSIYYRLAEYKIIESDDGHIWWEKHSGFCAVKMGSCFVNGSILFIEPGRTSEDNGFLKGEFLDQLDRLPNWKKTKYYCTSFNLVKCKINQNRNPSSAGNQFLQSSSQRDVSYRLGQFEIIETMDGRLLWKFYSGRWTIKMGTCYIDGNILFFRHRETEKTKIPKNIFIDRLLLLPFWEKTKFFCHNYTLHSCETNEVILGLDECGFSIKGENVTDAVNRSPPDIESNIKPKTAIVNFPQNHLRTLGAFCLISVSFILKVLFRLIIIMLRGLKIFIEGFALCGKWLFRMVFKSRN
jgi:hypothetical protein